MNSVKKVEGWLKDIIIGLNLCPFAKMPYEKGLIRISNTNAKSEEDQVHFFLDELEMLQNAPSTKISTSLISFSSFDDDFYSFNDFVGLLENLLDELNLTTVFQLVAFHPDFHFDGLDYNDRVNLVNRSPIPLIHLIRFEEIEMVTTSESMGEEISQRNEKVLKSLSENEIKALFGKYLSHKQLNI